MFIAELLLLLSVCAFARNVSAKKFEVPVALVEPLSPQGLRVSIPHVNGIQLFAFHGKINKRMHGLEGGDLSRDVNRAENGRWTFFDDTVELKPGDVIYYWTYVDYFDGSNKLGYRRDDQTFTVEELIPIDQDLSVSVTSSTARPCIQSITKVNGQSTCKGKGIFLDNFSQLSASKWKNEIRFAGPPDYEFVVYSAFFGKTFYVNDNRLHIRPMFGDDIYGSGFVKRPGGLDLGTSCTGNKGTADCFQIHQAWMILPPVVSSKITTKHNFSFKYGKIEFKAKLPKGDWIYPELYLEPKSNVYGPHYDSGQMRIAFLPGNVNMGKALQGGVIFGNTTAARKHGMRQNVSNEDWYDKFHIYAIKWTDDQIMVKVDNHIYGVIKPTDGSFANDAEELGLSVSGKWRRGSKMAPFDQEMYITIGVGVGGHSFEDKEDGSKPWINSDPKSQLNFYKAMNVWKPTWGSDSELIIDYVKVWAV